MVKLNNNALELLKNRYYLRNKETGELIEHTPEEMFRRVAKHVSSAEKTYELKKYWENEFFNLMNEQLFMPNSPTLMNAGKNKCLSACSVIGEYPDSLEGIYEYLWYNAKLTKYGCGVGQSLSRIRPKGEIIKSSGGKSAGVVNWMHSIQTVATTTIQGDTARRAANMVGLRFNHPDILDFINSKKGNDNFSAMNISVTITDEEFIKAINRDEIWLEWNNKKYTKVNAGELLDKIIENAWADGEPGIIFVDRINKDNPFGNNEKYRMDITNPCVAGDTLILTDSGYIPIKDITNTQVKAWNGYEFSTVVPKITGYNQKMMEIEFSDGSKLKCTPYHKFVLKDGARVEAKDLKTNDQLIKYNFPLLNCGEPVNSKVMYTRGFFSGDGSIEINRDRNSIWLYNEKRKLLPYLDYEKYNICKGNRYFVKLKSDSLNWSKDFVPDAKYDIDARLNWLAGIIDSDGSINNKNGSVAIYSNDQMFLIKIKYMLNTLGCTGVVLLSKRADKKFMPDGQGGYKKYNCKSNYRLTINSWSVAQLMKLGLKTKRVKLIANPSRNSARFVKIKNIKKLKEREATVYCFTEPINHTGIFNGVMTSQCGEQPLQAFEFCNLGSINVEKLYSPEVNDIDWDLFDDIIKKSIRFLDNIIDVNEYVLPQFKKNVLGNRKIGLGVTGLANLLIKLGIKYDSEECLDFIDEFFKFKKEREEKHNKELALEKGNFPNWKDSIFAKTNIPRRNATISTQAPTGSISTILGTESYGIEPLFMIGYLRRIVDGEILEVNQLFEERLHKTVNNYELENEITNKCIEEGTIELDIVPQQIKDIFRCANDISPEWHVKTLARMQKYYDNAISKTVNLPENATQEDVKNVYMQAFNLGCKGVTVYRNNSRLNQTIQIGDENKQKNNKLERGVIIQCSDDLIGKKRKLQTGCGSLHINAFFDPITGELMEVFFSKGSTGGCFAYMNALSRQISSGLRSGQVFEAVIDQLNSIQPCPSYVRRNALYNDTSKGSSCPNAIGYALVDMQNEMFNELGIDKQYKNNNIQPIQQHNQRNNKSNTKEICPNCGEELQTVEGCLSCMGCGWSRCN